MSGHREGESPGLVKVRMADLEHCLLVICMLELEIQGWDVRNFGF